MTEPLMQQYITFYSRWTSRQVSQEKSSISFRTHLHIQKTLQLYKKPRLYKLGKIRMMHFRQSLKIFYFLFLRTVKLYVTCNIQYPQWQGYVSQLCRIHLLDQQCTCHCSDKPEHNFMSELSNLLYIRSNVPCLGKSTQQLCLGQ